MGVYMVCPATPPTVGAVPDELAERGVGSTLEGLREHHDDHVCLEWGCRALRSLIMDRYIVLCYAVCHVICHTACHVVCRTVSCCMSHCAVHQTLSYCM